MIDYPHFSAKELQCKCRLKTCPRHGMDDAFMRLLIRLREYVDMPLVITSAYRCPEYNQTVSTTGLTGPHTTGKAVDISVTGDRAILVLHAALAFSFKGIGVHQKGVQHGRYIHLDMARLAPTIWTY